MITKKKRRKKKKAIEKRPVPTLHPDFRRTDEEAIKDFYARKQKNIDSFSSLGYSLSSDQTLLIKLNKKGKNSFGACVMCYTPVKGDPYGRGAKISPLCLHCIRDFFAIDDHLKSPEKKKKQLLEGSNLSKEIDFDQIGRWINNKQATLAIIGQKYQLTNEEVKRILQDKFGDKIVFRQRRGGEVVRNAKGQEIKTMDNATMITPEPVPATAPTPKKPKPAPQPVSIDWAEVDKAIQNKQAKIGKLAEQYNLTSNEMKSRLVKHYGQRIEFVRGRYGGVFYTNSSV